MKRQERKKEILGLTVQVLLGAPGSGHVYRVRDRVNSVREREREQSCGCCLPKVESMERWVMLRERRQTLFSFYLQYYYSLFESICYLHLHSVEFCLTSSIISCHVSLTLALTFTEMPSPFTLSATFLSWTVGDFLFWCALYSSKDVPGCVICPPSLHIATFILLYFCFLVYR